MTIFIGNKESFLEYLLLTTTCIAVIMCVARGKISSFMNIQFKELLGEAPIWTQAAAAKESRDS